jgi:hypothetical protein
MYELAGEAKEPDRRGTGRPLYHEPADQDWKIILVRHMADEALFDIIIPPGVPRSIIAEVVKKFDVKLVERKERIRFANMEGDERELLAFRGKREVMEDVEKYMRQRLEDFIRED